LNYYWVRIYDYHKDEELKFFTENESWQKFRGTLLDEYYLCGETLTRDKAKEEVFDRSGVKKFAKPRKADEVYAIVLESTDFFYDRFTKEIDTLCFNCYRPIIGKMKDFPHIEHEGVKYHCCSYECKGNVFAKTHSPEGEFQVREDYKINGGTYGYIYHIYNRRTNMHYVGQSIYMPFFRWQEHVKAGEKGDICDLVFETITEVRGKSQEYLNNIEAWWVKKYISDFGRKNVMNIVVPHITIEHLIVEYSKIVEGQMVFEC